MDDPPSVPIVFANRVIRQFADHLLGGDTTIEPRDYLVLRVIFRKMGGAWIPLVKGDIKHLTLLEQILSSWGKMPGRKNKVKEEV